MSKPKREVISLNKINKADDAEKPKQEVLAPDNALVITPVIPEPEGVVPAGIIDREKEDFVIKRNGWGGWNIQFKKGGKIPIELDQNFTGYEQAESAIVAYVNNLREENARKLAVAQ